MFCCCLCFVVVSVVDMFLVLVGLLLLLLFVVVVVVVIVYAVAAFDVFVVVVDYDIEHFLVLLMIMCCCSYISAFMIKCYLFSFHHFYDKNGCFTFSLWRDKKKKKYVLMINHLHLNTKVLPFSFDFFQVKEIPLFLVLL